MLSPYCCRQPLCFFFHFYFFIIISFNLFFPSATISNRGGLLQASILFNCQVLFRIYHYCSAYAVNRLLIFGLAQICTTPVSVPLAKLDLTTSWFIKVNSRWKSVKSKVFIAYLISIYSYHSFNIVPINIFTHTQKNCYCEKNYEDELLLCWLCVKLQLCKSLEEIYFVRYSASMLPSWCTLIPFNTDLSTTGFHISCGSQLVMRSYLICGCTPHTGTTVFNAFHLNFMKIFLVLCAI